MEVILQFISTYNIEIILGLFIGLLLLFSLCLVTMLRIKTIKERYDIFVRGMKGINLEELLIHTDREIKDITRDINTIEQDINNIETKLAFAIQRVGFLRYNAFGGMGSELSFSLALLDNFQNGFVLTSIYGRENTVSYAKPLKNGQCKIPLSAEEIIVIDRAIKGEVLEKTF